MFNFEWHLKLLPPPLPAHHAHVTDCGEVPDEDVDMDYGGAAAAPLLAVALRPQSRVVHFRAKNLVQDLFLHLTIVYHAGSRPRRAMILVGAENIWRTAKNIWRMQRAEIWTSQSGISIFTICRISPIQWRTKIFPSSVDTLLLFFSLTLKVPEGNNNNIKCSRRG